MDEPLLAEGDEPGEQHGSDDYTTMHAAVFKLGGMGATWALPVWGGEGGDPGQHQVKESKMVGEEDQAKMKEAGLNPESIDDVGEYYKDKEYSLRQFFDPLVASNPDEKVELQDWFEEGGDTDANKERLDRAREHLFWTLKTLLQTGFVLWGLVCLAGILSWKFSDCEVGPPWEVNVLLVAGVATQMYQMVAVTREISTFTVEGRPMVSMIRGFAFLDGYRFMAVFAVLDMMGRFSRAQFVGFAVACDAQYNHELIESFKRSPLFFLAPFIEWIGGLGGLAALSWLVGPMLIGQGYMLYCSLTVYFHLSKEQPADNADDWHAYEILDEIGSLGIWAMLDPVGKIFQKAALPPELGDCNDGLRCWQSLRSKTYAVAAKLVPDNIIQMQLQARFLALAFPYIDNMGRGSLVASFALTAGDALNSSLEIVFFNTRLTVAIGSIILLFSFESILRVFAAFLCTSHVFNVSDFSCAQIHLLKNFTEHGVIPT